MQRVSQGNRTDVSNFPVEIRQMLVGERAGRGFVFGTC